MFWYHEMVQLHVLLAMGSIALFFARGLGAFWGAHWPMDDRLRTLGGGLDFLLTMVGLSLWGLLHLNPLYYPWLTSKFVLLGLYVLFANLALRWASSTEGRLLGYVLALASLGLLVGVSLTKDPWAGLL